MAKATKKKPAAARPPKKCPRCKGTGKVKAGAKSGPKGKAFERQIGRDLRLIYDGADWCGHYDGLNKREQVVMLKSSRVRRGEQGKGAREADLCVAERTWWFELCDENEPRPVAKLEQAERDIEHKGEVGKWLAVAITHKTRSPTIYATMRGRSFVYLVTGRFPQPGPVDDAPVTFQYTTLLELLQLEENGGERNFSARA
jgi:hypothetical protein